MKEMSRPRRLYLKYRWSVIAVVAILILLLSPLIGLFGVVIGVFGSLGWWGLWTEWIGAVVIAAAIGYIAWREYQYTRLHHVPNLYIELHEPDEHRDLPYFVYRNEGDVGLIGRIYLYIYPNLKGRSDELDPLFREKLREEIKSMGPAETQDLRLGPKESRIYPYMHDILFAVLNFHRYIPQWVAIEGEYGPELTEGKPIKEVLEIFHLLYFPGKDNPYNGRWFISKMGVSTVFHWRKWNRETWKGEIPEEFRQGNEKLYFKSMGYQED